MKKFREMNEAERAAWGDAEAAARRADLEGVKSEQSLTEAKANAAARRKLIGATIGQATALVIQSTRRARGLPA
jgi:hypothetical protein